MKRRAMSKSFGNGAGRTFCASTTAPSCCSAGAASPTDGPATRRADMQLAQLFQAIFDQSEIMLNVLGCRAGHGLEQLAPKISHIF
ncbi:hypothetical protein ACRQ5Q_17735 [Bradyrhizobium sp. PMVTL-01]|uniref:hypothetical protein n=1 Tax=Bradyrhizobium sp. PMVTL-01 TaxID=3434999 RepID=UPI003F6EA940